jgi:thiol-disulfide isomerase/thioredoxin
MKRVLLIGGAIFGILALVCAGSVGILHAAAQQQAGAAAAATQKPTPPPAQDPTQARQILPEQQAYNEAAKITDPDKRIEALRKVIADFAKTNIVGQAENTILSTMVRKASDDIKRVQEQAKKMAEAPPAARGCSNYGSLATMLSNANILLDDAETYAQKALAGVSDEKAFIEAQKKAFADRPARNPGGRGGAPPDDAQLSANFRSQRQSALVTLAQVFDKRGKATESEKTFKEAFQLQPKGAAAATAALKLADFAKIAGRDQEQIEYLTVAALAGRLTADYRKDLEAAYKKTHNGSLAGLNESLDARYEKERFKFEVKPYEKAKDRSDRVVLAEIFTGSGCPPCVGADLAFEGAMERYKAQDLAVLMYHLHIPRPDPMTNPSTQARAKFYAVNAVPSYAIDGDKKVGGGGAENAPRIFSESVQPTVDKRLAVKADVKLALQASMTGSTVRVKADVGKVKIPAKHVRLQVALVEEQVRYSGENGVRFHPMVVRSMAATDKDTQGFAVDPAKGLKLDQVMFDVDRVVAEAKAHLDDFEVNSERFGKFQFMEKKHEIDPKKLVVVAFVQDEDSKQILQSVYVKLAPAWAGPVRAIQAPQAQATAAARQAPDKKAQDTKAADQKPAQPAPPPVPAMYQPLVDAAKITDPAKRMEAIRKAIADIQAKQASASSASSMPPEYKLYTDATRMTDPGKKLEALQKILKDYPKTGLANTINTEILVALIADAKKKVLDQANLLIQAVPETSPIVGSASRAPIYNTVADRLMVGELLLDEAEGFAKKSIGLWDEKQYVEGMKKSYSTMAAAMAKSNPAAKPLALPTDEDVRQQFREQKAVSETTLAEIYMKKGRDADAEKILKGVYAAVPTKALSTGYLADLAKKAGREKEMTDYLLALAVSGPLNAERRKDLEASWRKTHDGTLDGLEATLDERYEKANPNPVKVTPYERTKNRSDRVVLAEIFTGAGCPPCVGADLAFEGALGRYKGQDLAVLMYHLHIPRPDPMTNPSTIARGNFYGVNGVPAFYIDGETDGKGGGGASAAPRIYEERVAPVIEKRLVMTADARITLQAAMSGPMVRVNVAVAPVKSQSKKLKLQLALVEERIRYTGENGVRFHPMVVRSLGGKDAFGFALEPGKALKQAWTFDVDAIVAEAKKHLDDFEVNNERFGKFQFAEKKHAIDATKLSVVAFVQDEETKKILQAATFKLGAAGKKTD